MNEIELTPARKEALRACWEERSLTELADFIEAHYHGRAASLVPEVVTESDEILRNSKEDAHDAGLDMDTVRERIGEARQQSKSQSGAKRDWQEASLAELADHIEETHHAFLREVLSRISERFVKAIKAHDEKHGDMLRDVQSTFNSLREEIEAHLMKEEQILFPYLREMSVALDAGKPLPPMHCGSVAHPIRQMEHEHENAGEALSGVRKRTSGYSLPNDACPTFAGLYEDLQALEADLHEHIFPENNILFPRAEEAETESGNS